MEDGLCLRMAMTSVTLEENDRQTYFTTLNSSARVLVIGHTAATLWQIHGSRGVLAPFYARTCTNCRQITNFLH